MKSILLTLSILFAIHSNSSAQKIPQDDMIPMFHHYAQKNWDSLYIVTSNILKKYPDDTTNFKSNINYAFFIAAAGKTATHRMSYPELREALKPFLGRSFLTPVHATTIDKKLNQTGVTLISRDKSGSKATTLIRTADEKTVLCIEEFILKKNVTPSTFKPKYIRCGGKLFSIEINSKMDNTWIIHLVFTDSYYL